MNERSIKKLRLKFILISFCSLFFIMLIIAGFISGTNAILSERSIHKTLNYIIEKEGHLPGSSDLHMYQNPNTDYDMDRFFDEIFGQDAWSDDASSKLYNTTIYFAILYDQSLTITDVISYPTVSISQKEAQEFGSYALSQKASFGRYGIYYYQIANLPDKGTIVVYLDGSDIMEGNTRILYLAMVMILFGIILAAILTLFFSKWAIAPEIRNMELQKRFVTNASHELKTPLAVIRANTEMEEILSGETEWTQSTMRQIDRMNGLVQNLVMIAKAEECLPAGDLSECDITNAINETIHAFSSVITQEKKVLSTGIQEHTHMLAIESQIRQLCSILMDNAIKYCDENGTISVHLRQKGKGIQLIVSNDYAAGAGTDYSKFFERFYREDSSHNTDKGGYGIGLSIAESIIKQYRGTITASWKKGIISFQCLLRPMRK